MLRNILALNILLTFWTIFVFKSIKLSNTLANTIDSLVLRSLSTENGEDQLH